jgi:tripartite-type tricarboxylate transporter receptor subunit TctC
MIAIFRCVTAAAGLSMLAFTAGLEAQAQNFPVRPIRYVVAFSPGGVNDILARIIGQKLADSWGQPVIVDNRAGAGGNLGTELVAKSTPDGYTILNVSTAQVISQSLYAKLGYSLERDLAPVVLLAYTPLVVTVHNGIAAKTVPDLVAVSKSMKLVNASGGHGTISHLSGEMLKRAVGFEATHVPYKGNGPAIPDMMSGQAHLLINGIPDLLPAIKSGRVRAIAIMADKRHSFLPEVSTMADQGYKDFVLGNWVGIVMPTGTPKPIIDKMYSEVARLMKLPDVVEKVVQQGFDPAVSTPDEFGKRIKNEITRFGRAVKESGARVD